MTDSGSSCGLVAKERDDYVLNPKSDHLATSTLQNALWQMSQTT